MKRLGIAGSVGVAGATLVFGLLLQLAGDHSAVGSGETKAQELAQALPTTAGSATVRDEPIASTEEMHRAVGQLLNFDDAVFRMYQTQDGTISVYVARWRAGKMSPRLIAAHTPDVCWPANGWKKAEENLSWPESMAARFAAPERRVFTSSRGRQQVVFWHKVGDKFLNYHTNSTPPWWAPISEVWHEGLRLRQEQLFVRVSSDGDLWALLSRPEFGSLQDALVELGLGRR